MHYLLLNKPRLGHSCPHKLSQLVEAELHDQLLVGQYPVPAKGFSQASDDKAQLVEHVDEPGLAVLTQSHAPQSVRQDELHLSPASSRT